MTTPLFHQLSPGARVLFIRLRNLGEAVLDTANLRALKRQRPDLRLVTLVESVFADLYSADPDIDVIAVDRSPQVKRSSVGARAAIIKQIRTIDFDAVINLHGGPASTQFVALSGAIHRAGARHFRPGIVYNWKIPPAEEILGRGNLHTVESQFAWFKWLGLELAEPLPTSLFVDIRRRDAVRAVLKSRAIDPDIPYAVLSPTNEFFTKRWPPESYGVIADYLSSQGMQIIATGAPTDEQRMQLAEVSRGTRTPICELSSLNIGELTALIATARVFVGNDSGPAHIAAALKVPAVVLFGPASSVRWRPWKAPSALVQNYFACNPCAMYTCEAFDEPKCILSITVDQVIQAIDTLHVTRS
jgi:lipopolysaccharide heptosyltransferase III